VLFRWTTNLQGPRLFIEVCILHQHQLAAKTAKIERRHFGLLLAVLTLRVVGVSETQKNMAKMRVGHVPTTVQRGSKQRRRWLFSAAFIPATCIVV
jgi:hypothetical protein